MKIKVCTWNACRWKYSEYILRRLKADIDFHKLDWIVLEESMCMWHCKEWPNVQIDKNIEHFSNPVKASKLMMDKKNGVKPKKKRKNKSNDKQNENL